ncbi:MAG: SDR family oxidoreductase [Alphaproteobacteria bacterium]
MSSLFCFGLGYCATRLALDVMAAGWRVAGTHRPGDPPPVKGLVNATVLPFGRERPLAPAMLAGVTHVLVSIPPDGDGDATLAVHGEDLARLPSLAWLGYLSTTGVYGDTGGAWVDETSPLRPTVARSARRAEAEQAWLELLRRLGVPVHVFRLAGIYGPGRSPIDNVRADLAHRIVKPGHVFGRIHVEDVAAVLRASMARPNPGAIYNVCDDEPAPPQDVVAHACQLLGIAPPPEVPYEQAAATLSPMALSFYADSRRVRNDRIKTDLGVTLRYPSYREGLRTLV